MSCKKSLKNLRTRFRTKTWAWGRCLTLLPCSQLRRGTSETFPWWLWHLWGHMEQHNTAGSGIYCLKNTSLHLGLTAGHLLLPSCASDATQRTKVNEPMWKAKSNLCSPANAPRLVLALFQLRSWCLLWQLNNFLTLSLLRKPQHSCVLLLPEVQSMKTTGQPYRVR